MVAGDTPLFSIVIPTYNRAGVLGGTLNSVLGQTIRAIEVIIVDDHSNDETEALVDSFRAEAQTKGIKLGYIRLERNSGANHARNVGIAAASGKYVAFLDSDDFWHPRKLEFQLERIRELSDDAPVFCFTSRYRINEDFEIIAHQYGPAMENPRQELRKRNSVGTLSSVVIDRASAQAIGGFDEKLRACQDWDFYLKAAERCPFLRVDLPLTIYVDGSGDRISLNSRRRARAHLQIYRRYLRGQKRRNLAELYRNLAEDMAKMGRAGLARRFYLGHLMAKRRRLRALLVRVGIGDMPDLVSQRHAAYRRAGMPNPTLQGSSRPTLEEYRELFSAVAAARNATAAEVA